MAQTDVIETFERLMVNARRVGDRVGEGMACAVLGQNYWALGQMELAKERFQRACSIARETGDRGAEGRASSLLGVVYGSLREYRSAIEMFELAIRRAQETSDTETEGEAYRSLGQAYFSLGEFRRATEVQKKALEIAQKRENREAEGAVRRDLGVCFQALGEYRKVIEMQEQALAIAKESGNRAAEAEAYGHIGNAYTSLGEYRRVIEVQEQGLRIAREIGDRKREGRLYGNLGVVFKSLGEYKKAIEMHERHLAIARESGDRSEEGDACNNLGITFQWLGDYRQSIAMQEKALAITQELGIRAGQGRALGNMGASYAFLGQYRTAIELQEQHLEIARETGNRGGEGGAYCNLGNAYHALGEAGRAVAMFEKVLEIARETGDRRSECTASGNMGNALFSLGQYERAAEMQETRLAIARETGDRGAEGAAYGDLGIVFDAVGRHAEAFELHEKELEIARETGDRGREVSAYAHLGTALHSQAEYGRAIEMQQRAVEVAREIGDVRSEGQALHNIGCAHEERGEAAEGLQAGLAGLRRLQRVERELGEGQDSLRRSLFEVQQQSYQLIQRLLVCMRRPALAMAVSELSKARGLSHMLLGDDMYVAEEGADADMMAGVEAEWLKMCHDVRAVGCPVVAYSWVGDARLLVWVVSAEGEVMCSEEVNGREAKDLQALLPVMEGAFEAAVGGAEGGGNGAGQEEEEEVGEERVLAWLDALLEAEGSVEQEERGALGQMKPDAASWGKALRWASRSQCAGEPSEVQRRVMSAPEVALKELHRRLLPPAVARAMAEACEGDDAGEVLLLPQRELFRVPWPALLDAEGRHLIEQHAVRVSPSLTVARAAATRRAGGGPTGGTDLDVAKSGGGENKAVVVGNPWPLAAGFQSLRFAEEEARAVQKRLEAEGMTVDVMLREAATVGGVREGVLRARWVHFACHGEVLRGAGEWGEEVSHRLLLAREGGSEGHLSAQDVEGLQLAEGATVVLSCCQSGLGEMTGEGVIGLSRSFLAAGAGALVVAVCKIPDQSSAQLMERLYSLHLAHGRGMSERLSLAASMRSSVMQLAGLQREEEGGGTSVVEAASRAEVSEGEEGTGSSIHLGLRAKKGAEMSVQDKAKPMDW